MNPKKPPFDPEKIYQRALMLHHEGKFKEAEDLYKTLLAYFPNQVEILTAFATALLQQNKHDEGVKQFKKSLSINPHQPSALYNLGVEFQKHAKLEEALNCYNQALKLNPQDIYCLINRGNTLKDLKRHIDAIESFNHALALIPDSNSSLWASIQWNKALTLISLGHYEEGWKLYECGWAAGERVSERKYTQPTWLGKESIRDKNILIYEEQGFGDFIQFCRYIPMVEALGAKVTIQVSAPLVELAKSLKGEFHVISDKDKIPTTDFVCPVISLPHAFKTTLKNIPNEAYLFADANQKEIWKQKLGKKNSPRIGIVWSGSLTNKIDKNPCSKRSVPLEELQTLFDLPFEFHVLQKEFSNHDIQLLPNIQNIHLHQNKLLDFATTAALIDQMDLVVSTCTAVAHLAGALGKETWVLLPYSADYRWLVSREDSPWYPSTKLIQQRAIGNWSDVIRHLKTTLKSKFNLT